MPRFKKSKGTVRFKTVFPDEFQRYLMYELANSRHWNPTIMTGGMTGPNRWKYECDPKNGEEFSWSIEYNGSEIVCVSALPKIYIRKGLEILMGDAKIVIGGMW